MKADKPQYLADRLVNVFVQFGRDPDASARGVPSVLDMITDPTDLQVVKLILANLEMSRPFIAPPSVPADRLALLRKAFDATAKDPAFLAAAAKSGREISVIDANEINTLLTDSYRLPKDIVQRALDISAARP
jgi:hypothetical protein